MTLIIPKKSKRKIKLNHLPPMTGMLVTLLTFVDVMYVS